MAIKALVRKVIEFESLPDVLGWLSREIIVEISSYLLFCDILGIWSFFEDTQ